MSSSSQVLARKYRPQVFADLVGQEALVQTISNAIAMNRLAHAYMLTGIRGVGKTSSARIIAKGLNCIGPDGKGGMTPNPCGQCQHCVDIANDSHIDVIEIDAASNTGVDNVREIIEGAKYNPVSARFKIYIIDEVHMLSKQAFNALLKTLEEPPERVKFIFATTEIRKVPITILSRCQRFDLKRLSETALQNHLAHICVCEKAETEPDALKLIARAGDGSVRDSLSLLDQALTQFDGHLTVDGVRQMLGLADRTALFDLYEALMKGDMVSALSLLEAQYECGADPLVLVQDLLELTHWLTRIKIVPELSHDITIPEAERTRGLDMAGRLTMSSLTGAWQVLLKGLAEVKSADNPLKTLEMVLIRLAYLSDLPSPLQVIEDIKKNGLADQISKPVFSSQTGPSLGDQNIHSQTKIVSPSVVERVQETANEKKKEILKLTSLTDIIRLARSKGERLLAFNIENYIRPIDISNGVLTCSFTDESPRFLGADLSKFLTRETGINWIVREERENNSKTIKEEKIEKENRLLDSLKKTGLVADILAVFPSAKIEKVRPQKPENIDSDADESADRIDE